MTNMISTGNVSSMIMAGGRGERLFPLTKDRAKPAVPFGGPGRIIDFAVNNLLSSGIRKIYILTQTKQDSLKKHIDDFWKINNYLGDEIDCIPAQMRVGNNWYQGTADAIRQNLHILDNNKTEQVVILAGDHVYYMNVNEVLKFHQDNNADLTIIARPTKKMECPINSKGDIEYGIVFPNLESIITNFKEKPPLTEITEDDVFVSMGNYIFNTDTLKDTLKDKPKDIGNDVINKLIKEGKKVMMYDFSKNNVPGMIKNHEKNYWADVGTLDSYYGASMDLVSIQPKLNLYSSWALWNTQQHKNYASTKFVFNEGITEEFLNKMESEGKRLSMASESIVAAAGIIGGVVIHSVIGPHAKIHSYARINNSVLLGDIEVGRYCRIKNSIIDKNVFIPERTEVGYDHEVDVKRGFTISTGGITVIPKGYIFK